MSNVKIGSYLYNAIDLPFTAKVLGIIKKRKNGVALTTIADQSEIKGDFGGDDERTQTKVRTVLSNLKLRNVVQATQNERGFTMYKLSDDKVALEIIAQGNNLTEKMTQSKAETAVIVDDAAKTVKNTKKVKAMTTKKNPRMFVNPETNKVEPFGAGRPSKMKLAFECDAEGKFLNPNAALEFKQNGGKSEDKLTKAELIDLLRKVRAERDALVEAIEVFKAASLAVDAASVVVVSDSDDSDDNDDSLDLEAESCDDDCDDNEAVAG